MDYEYPLIPDDLHMQPLMISAYLDICRMLVSAPEKTWISYDDIFAATDAPVAGDSVKNLLRRMEYAGIIKRAKNGNNRFSPYTKLFITPAGRHWLTCRS